MTKAEGKKTQWTLCSRHIHPLTPNTGHTGQIPATIKQCCASHAAVKEVIDSGCQALTLRPYTG